MILLDGYHDVCVCFSLNKHYKLFKLFLFLFDSVLSKVLNLSCERHGGERVFINSVHLTLSSV